MTSSFDPCRWWSASVALVLAISSLTAYADPRVAPKIPTLPAPSSSELPSSPDEAPSSELLGAGLPLPYEAWQGPGFAPPRTPVDEELNRPLARAPRAPRRPLEVTAALAAFLPSCGSGSLDDRACLTLEPGSGLDAALLYRPTPFFAVGGELALSGFRSAGGRRPWSSAGGGARFFGVTGRVYFADEGSWDPYVALTLGVGSLTLRGELPGESSVSTRGLGARVAGGVDYLLSARLRLGPTVSFSRWLAWSEQQCEASVCGPAPAAYGRVLGFATLGLRLTASFGDVL